MIRFRLAGPIFVVALLVVACMYALNAALETPSCPQPRLLFIGCGAGEYSQRTVAGAQDAAKELGVELEIQMPTPDDLVDQQCAIVRKINAANYDGVAISPADPETESELINDLARRTKLVTVDRDFLKSQRLCHVGYRQITSGALAAHLVREQMSRPGKVALLATTFSDDARNSNVSERLEGFKERWEVCEQNSAMPCPIIQVVTNSDFSAALADQKLVFIVALDSASAESALRTLTARSETRRVPMIAFDPGPTIFDAVDDGRVFSALFDDPYRNGFTAIQRLAAYRDTDKDSLPMPGRGCHFLVSEVVRKENLADFRRRLDHNSGGNNARVSSSGVAQLPHASGPTPKNVSGGTSS